MTGYAIHRCVTPAASLALVDLDQVKAELKISPADTSKDAQIQANIEQISQAINTYCDRIFVRQGYRDQIRSTYSTGLCCGTPLVLRQRPIAVDDGVPVVVITEGNIVLMPDQWEVDEQMGRIYRLDAGGIGAWGGNPIVVDYDAGYDAGKIPADLQAAALKSVTARYSNVGRDPMLRSQTIPDVVAESYWSSETSGGLSSTAIPAEAYAVLEAYVLRFM